ncbi:hypothetical protein GUJ93_ZPchr0012g21637 [Zizania palustris]|uniref:RRM domain-containing protein n=1 Tax=Zizania palustris TaxID=103762 RepID=A0A8J5WS12_ZIZPA|nr:hypothetical protein GUJ93_ZPchr0012g21637 [Zizania palustris]
MARVYVGNLDPRVTARELEDEFRVFGVLRSVWVARKPPGFAFVDFDDRRDAQDAIRDLDGKNGWRVELSRNASSSHGGRDRHGGSEMEDVVVGAAAAAAAEVPGTAGVQAMAEEVTVLQGALQGVAVCHQLVGAVLAGHHNTTMAATNLPPMIMDTAVAGARAEPVKGVMLQILLRGFSAMNSVLFQRLSSTRLWLRHRPALLKRLCRLRLSVMPFMVVFSALHSTHALACFMQTHENTAPLVAAYNASL